MIYLSDEDRTLRFIESVGKGGHGKKEDLAPTPLHPVSREEAGDAAFPPQS